MLKRIWSRRRELVGATAYWSGAAGLFELTHATQGALVLMYHSIGGPGDAEFVDPPNRLAVDEFERQMAFLAKSRKVVSLAQVVKQARRGEWPSRECVCITFDDGYLDNLTIAAPILARHSFPATLFLATGYVERGESQWSDVLHSILQRRTRHRLRLELPGLADVDLAGEGKSHAARRALHRVLLGADYRERSRLLTSIATQLEPRGQAPRLTMNWNEARRLRDEFPLFEFGGHTRDHVDLRSHSGAAARGEIEKCADDLSRELEIVPRHFSFPYGRWSPEARDLVVKAQWESAVGEGIDKRVGPGSDLYAIPRIEAPRGMADFRFRTSGAYPGLLSALGLH